MKRGFTLIELLGVIVLLAVLIIVAFPTIINFIKSSNEEKDELTLNLLYNAAEMHIENNFEKFPKKNGNSYCIDIKELVEEGLLKEPIKLSDVDIINTKSIQVFYQEKYSYKILDKDSCIENIQDF